MKTRKHRYRFLALTATVICVALKTARADFQSDFTDYVKAAGDSRDIGAAGFVGANSDASLTLVAAWLAHPSTSALEESGVLTLTLHLAREAPNAETRKASVRQLAGFLAAHPDDESHFGWLCRMLVVSPPADIDAESRKAICGLVERSPQDVDYIRLLGVVAEGNPACLEYLHTLADPLRTDPDAIYYKRANWAARLALARAGDPKIGEQCIKSFREEPDLRVRLSLLKDLAYTRQPAALAAVVEYVNSEERTPADPPDMRTGTVALYAAEALSEVLKDPPQFAPSTPGPYRTWITQHQPLPLK